MASMPRSNQFRRSTQRNDMKPRRMRHGRYTCRCARPDSVDGRVQASMSGAVDRSASSIAVEIISMMRSCCCFCPQVIFMFLCFLHFNKISKHEIMF